MIPIKKKHRSYRSGLLLCVAFLLLSVPTLWFMVSMHGSNIATTIPFFQGNHHRAPRPPCKVMIHVITKSTDFHRRQDIRLTWGADAKRLGMQVRFLIANVTSYSSQTSWISLALDVEHSQNYDLVRAATPGRGSRHMAFLVAGGLKQYVHETGRSSCMYFMKVDQNIYVRPSKLLNVLNRAERKTKNQFEDSMIYMGHIWLKGRVVRDPKSRWYITGDAVQKLGEQVKYYPPYASGKAYLVSKKLAHLLINGPSSENDDNNNTPRAKSTKAGCFSPTTVHLGPEDAQLGLCIDELLTSTSNNTDIAFVRTKSFDTNHCDAKSVVVEIDSASSLSSSSFSSSTAPNIGVLYHAHTVNLAGESLCSILHGQQSIRQASRAPHVLIAVTSSLKSFETRAKAITRTWGSPINLERHNIAILFFVGHDVKNKILEISDRIGIGHDQVVALKGVVDDEYPPVFKNTAMLTKVHAMLSHDESMSRLYDWVLKVDDDTLVNPQGLQFLNKFNPLDHKLYLGQQGMGRPADRGKLGIVKHFCMGGPGYMISRAALNMLGPHLKTCAKKKMTRQDHSWHSDVIVGLCMEEYAHIGCWDHDAEAVVKYQPDNSKRRFFHKYDWVNWPSRDILRNTATLHPLKDPQLMREKYQELIHSNPLLQ